MLCLRMIFQRFQGTLDSEWGGQQRERDGGDGEAAAEDVGGAGDGDTLDDDGDATDDASSDDSQS